MQKGFFAHFASKVAKKTGHAFTFGMALATIAIWGITGPFFHYSDTWQLVINTGTTVITFLMVFLIQNTQNRDSEAIHIKLDELIRANQKAHNTMLDLEGLTEKELDQLRETYIQLAHKAKLFDEAHRASSHSKKDTEF